jgi:hypothetical protein
MLRGFSRVEMLVATAIPVSRGERMAVREMQSVAQAQTLYRARFGKYAASLDQFAMAEQDGDGIDALGIRAGGESRDLFLRWAADVLCERERLGPGEPGRAAGVR